MSSLFNKLIYAKLDIINDSCFYRQLVWVDWYQTLVAQGTLESIIRWLIYSSENNTKKTCQWHASLTIDVRFSDQQYNRKLDAYDSCGASRKSMLHLLYIYQFQTSPSKCWENPRSIQESYIGYFSISKKYQDVSKRSQELQISIGFCLKFMENHEQIVLYPKNTS